MPSTVVASLLFSSHYDYVTGVSISGRPGRAGSENSCCLQHSRLLGLTLGDCVQHGSTTLYINADEPATNVGLSPGRLQV